MNITISLIDPNQKKVYQGQDVELQAQILDKGKHLPPKDLKKLSFNWSAYFGPYIATITPSSKDITKATLETTGAELGTYTVTLELHNKQDDTLVAKNDQPLEVEVKAPATLRGSGPITLGRSSVGETKDVSLWLNIRQGTDALSFPEYQAFINEVMCAGWGSKNINEQERKAYGELQLTRGTPFPGIDAYQMLKTATEVFVMLNCRALGDYDFSDPDLVADYDGRNDRNRQPSDLRQLWRRYLVHINGSEPGLDTLPYLALIRRNLGDTSLIQGDPKVRRAVEVCDGIVQKKLTSPCFIELIWSYWHEESMLVQTLHAIALRFQNQRTAVRDPLANLDIDPLRPLSNLLWGYIQDEQHRLTVARRAYEYDHHYGITLHGKAVPTLRSADSRSKFLEAFHNLLTACVTFYKQDDNTMIIADAFPVLTALKDVHLLLAEGAHNQFGDLPSTARIEMLLQQWLLARPEMREFIGGRVMVPYAEAWMDRVDSMKKLQNWTDVTVVHFNELARFGEQLLLSIRYGSWSEIHDSRFAANWARDWRPEARQFIDSYRAVTGVDLAPETVGPRVQDRDLQPSTHLRRRLELQHAQRSNEPLAAGSPRRQRNGGNGGVRVAVTRPAGSRAEMEVSEDF